MAQTELFKIPESKKIAKVVPKYVTPEIISQLTGLSKKSISNLKSRGTLPNSGEGKYDLVETISTYIKHIKTGTVTKKTEIEGQKLEKMTRENMQAADLLIDTEIASQIFMQLASTFVEQIEGLAPRVSAEIAALETTEEIQEFLYDETRRIRKAVAGIVESSEFNKQNSVNNSDSPQENS